MFVVLVISLSFTAVDCGIPVFAPTDQMASSSEPDFLRVPLCGSELDFPGEPYSVSVLKPGYALPPHADGTSRADGTISLITGPRIILVDTGGPWDRDFLLKRLAERGLEPGDVDVVVGTHGHSDHIGNLNLFPDALLIVGYDVSEGDTYRPSGLKQGRVYCVDQHVSVCEPKAPPNMITSRSRLNLWLLLTRRHKASLSLTVMTSQSELHLLILNKVTGGQSALHLR